MEGPKVVRDLELVYIHIAILASLVLMGYFIFFIDYSNWLTLFLSFIIFLFLGIIIFTNRNRYLQYQVDRKRLQLKGQAFLPFRSRTLERKSIETLYKIDNNRWRWMRGKDEKLALTIVMKEGGMIKIDQPPIKLETRIMKEWDMEIETISSVQLTRMRLESNK